MNILTLLTSLLLLYTPNGDLEVTPAGFSIRVYPYGGYYYGYGYGCPPGYYNYYGRCYYYGYGPYWGWGYGGRYGYRRYGYRRGYRHRQHGHHGHHRGRRR